MYSIRDRNTKGIAARKKFEGDVYVHEASSTREETRALFFYGQSLGVIVKKERG